MISMRRALRLETAPQLAFVGAGGKSSAMFALARQFNKTIITTSTHLSSVQAASADRHLLVQSAIEIESLDPRTLPRSTVITGPNDSQDRVTNPGADLLRALSEFARTHSIPLLIEADGARLRALKAPAEHEPAIPDFVDAVVVLAGLSALGKPLNDQWVHRPERFAEISGSKINETITPTALESALLNRNGGLKNIPEKARRVVLLNQADTHELKATARRLAHNLLNSFDAVWVGAIAESAELSAVYEPVAGVILAAGESKRLGQPKALMDWRGKPFIRHVAEIALKAKLDSVIVVTGAHSENVEPRLEGLPVQIIHNAHWQDGQSSSVKAGLRALSRRSGSALFMVVDQPQVPVSLIEALIAEHATSLAPIIAPMVDDHRTNPVLFDRSTFSDFDLVEGDTGGRALFSRHRVRWLRWLDSSLAIDVDTPEDYSRLMSKAG